MEIKLERRHDFDLRDNEQLSIIQTFNALELTAHGNSVAHGFWDDLDNMREALPPLFHPRFDALVKAEKIALMHSELSEMMEAVRKPGTMDQHLPDMDSESVEGADLLIRFFDYARKFKLQAATAYIRKHAYNVTRPFKHGKVS